MFAALATQPHQDTEERPVGIIPATETSLDPEVVALKKTSEAITTKS